MSISTWSFSQLKHYEGCPRKYNEITVLRNYADTTNEKAAYGSRVHEAAEAYFKEGTALPSEFAFAADTLRALRAFEGVKFAEHEMAVKHDLTPCAFGDPERWVRGIADLLVVGDGPIARVVDFKLGKSSYADTDQLDLMALMILAHFPHVKMVKGALLFLAEQKMIPAAGMKVETRDAPHIWQRFRERDARRMASFHSNNWPARSSGLCKRHCPVTSCEFNGSR